MGPESSLSKGTLYWYFENKLALFMGIMEAFMADMGAAFAEIMAAGGPASERLKAMSRLFWQMTLDDEGLAKLLLDAYAESSRGETLNVFIKKLYQPYLDMLTELIEQGIQEGEFRQVSPQAVAAAIAAMFDGLWFQGMLGMPVADYTDADDLIDWIMNGLLKA